MREVRGNILDVVRNSDGLYEDNLEYYFRIVWSQASNLLNPYHNFRHMLHVTWMCYEACVYYQHELTPVQMRALLIAAMLHDFNHPGRAGDDYQNIERAVAAMRAYLLPQDKPIESQIELLIRTTEFPHKTDTATLSLSAQILRDADLSQVLDPVWLQEVVFGLSAELGKMPSQVLEMQRGFLSSFRFATSWAQTKFPSEAIEGKIAEAEGFAQIV